MKPIKNGYWIFAVEFENKVTRGWFKDESWMINSDKVYWYIMQNNPGGAEVTHLELVKRYEPNTIFIEGGKNVK